MDFSLRGDSRPRLSGCDWSKPERIHHRNRPRSHGEYVTQNPAHSGRCPLEGLDERRVIVGFDLEGASPAVSDIDNARVLSRTLQHSLAARGQAFQVHARRFVGTVLAPHDAEDAEFGEGGLSMPEKLFDLFVLIRSKAVLPDDVQRKGRGDGSCHGEILLSHLREKSSSPFVEDSIFQW